MIKMQKILSMLQEFSKSDRIYVNVNVYMRFIINFELTVRGENQGLNKKIAQIKQNTIKDVA